MTPIRTRTRIFAVLFTLVLSAATLFALSRTSLFRGSLFRGSRLRAVLFRASTDTGSELPLSAYAPPGALLALESADFRALLHAWTSSPEEQRWLTSDDYAGFSRSRLFGRLADAQTEFATSAGLPPDSRFLASVAGHQTLFAWYDIGKLEFLYITRLPPGETDKLPLLALRDRYEARNSGGTPFYVRSEGEPARTVAFAVRGDVLLLATREDLLAGALQLMAHPTASTLQHEGWFAAGQAAASDAKGDLRLTLNLASVVRSPYFRTYWIQRNITEMKAYSAEVSDLYRSPGEFREERVLLRSEPAASAPASAPVDLAPLMRFVPPGAIYRATAHPGDDAVLAQLADKLLARSPGEGSTLQNAPQAELSVSTTGTASDLEQRIDEPPVAQPARAAAEAPLRAELSAAGPVSMLVFSRLEPHVPSRDSSSIAQPAARPLTAPAPDVAASDSSESRPSGDTAVRGDMTARGDDVFQPVHSAIVLQASHDWNPVTLQAALISALAPGLSVSSLGLNWQPSNGAAGASGSSGLSGLSDPSAQSDHRFRLQGFEHLALLTDGKLCIVASDEETLLAAFRAAMPTALPAASASPSPAVLAQVRAGVDLASARLPLTELAKRLDHVAAAPGGTVPSDTAQAPPFLAGNMVSLGNTFAGLASETFTETVDDKAPQVHQQVLYRWKQ